MKKVLILAFIVAMAAYGFGKGWTRIGGMTLDYGRTPPADPPGPVCAFCNIDPDEDGFITYGAYYFHQAGGLRYGILSVDNSIDSNDAYITQTIPAGTMNPANGGVGNMGANHGWHALPRNGATGVWVEMDYGTGEVDRYEFASSDNWQMLYAEVTPNTIGEGGGGPMGDLIVRIGILKDPAVTTGTRSVSIDTFLMWVYHIPLSGGGGYAQWINYLFDLKADWRENLIVLRPSENPLTVTEGGITTTYDIVSTDEYYGNWAPIDDVYVTVTPDSQTEINGQGAGNPVVLTFAPEDYNVPQTVTVKAIDDAVVEGPHTSTITHSVSSADADYNQAIIEPLTIEIEDNDLKEIFVTVVDPPMDVAEEGETTDTYTIHLGAQPSANVTITATRSSDDVTLDVGGGPLASVDLIFTPANYETPQTITVKAVDDTSIEDPIELVTITHVASGGDAEYNALSIDSAEVEVEDNEEYCGEPGQPYLDGDIGGAGGCGDEFRDCHVNFYDLNCSVIDWLDCTNKFFAECEQW